MFIKYLNLLLFTLQAFIQNGSACNTFNCENPPISIGCCGSFFLDVDKILITVGVKEVRLILTIKIQQKYSEARKYEIPANFTLFDA